MFDPASFDPGKPHPSRPRVLISVNWAALGFLAASLGIAVFVARTWSAEAGAGVFVAALGAMVVAAIRSRNRSLDAGIASGFEPIPHQAAPGESGSD
jgi:hypothetical protein